MLTIPGCRSEFCDGVTRRSFLRIGGLAFGGLSLTDILRAESQQQRARSHKSIIMIVLPGGPPHLDMFDMKPEAPAEIRGEFKPISTNVPGIQITELMPRTAAMMDRFAIVRSLYGARNDHNVHICLTGWETHPRQEDSPSFGVFPQESWPSIGAVLSKLQGSARDSMPPFLSLATKNAESMTRASLSQPGFLGIGHTGFETNRHKQNVVTYGSGVRDEAFKAQQRESADFVLRDISIDRLDDRKQLHASLDRFRRNLEVQSELTEVDTVQQQAFSLLASNQLATALDWQREDIDLHKNYGISDSAVPVKGGPELIKQFVVARRLVEAGARCVTLAFSQWPLERESRGGFNWDWHSDNFNKARASLPMLDTGLSALVLDLEQRGMLDDVSIVIWGEFGRTPRINGDAGRDHWPNAASVLLAGGGMQSGQVIGATDRHGSEPTDRPVQYREIFATLYHQLGIEPHQLVLDAPEGRSYDLLGGAKPISDLI
ncbi:MAG: hypothetical protein CMJ81_12695 [Planctomycetaceae bacterium]|nr:hypothetical protein [Planctomycetaceae bacterium]